MLRLASRRGGRSAAAAAARAPTAAARRPRGRVGRVLSTLAVQGIRRAAARRRAARRARGMSSSAAAGGEGDAKDAEPAAGAAAEAAEEAVEEAAEENEWEQMDEDALDDLDDAQLDALLAKMDAHRAKEEGVVVEEGEHAMDRLADSETPLEVGSNDWEAVLKSVQAPLEDQYPEWVPSGKFAQYTPEDVHRLLDTMEELDTPEMRWEYIESMGLIENLEDLNEMASEQKPSDRWLNMAGEDPIEKLSDSRFPYPGLGAGGVINVDNIFGAESLEAENDRGALLDQVGERLVLRLGPRLNVFEKMTPEHERLKSRAELEAEEHEARQIKYSEALELRSRRKTDMRETVQVELDESENRFFVALNEALVKQGLLSESDAADRLYSPSLERELQNAGVATPGKGTAAKPPTLEADLGGDAALARQTQNLGARAAEEAAMSETDREKFLVALSEAVVKVRGLMNESARYVVNNFRADPSMSREEFRNAHIEWYIENGGEELDPDIEDRLRAADFTDKTEHPDGDMYRPHTDKAYNHRDFEEVELSEMLGAPVEHEWLYQSPLNPPDVPQAVEETIYQLYLRDPVTWNFRELASRFGLRVERVRAIALLKQVEIEDEERGELQPVGMVRENVSTVSWEPEMPASKHQFKPQEVMDDYRAKLAREDDEAFWSRERFRKVAPRRRNAPPVDGSAVDAPADRKSRYRMLVSDTSTRGESLEVRVRERTGELRNATREEQTRAVQIELPWKGSRQRSVLSSGERFQSKILERMDQRRQELYGYSLIPRPGMGHYDGEEPLKEAPTQ